jgi:hypothetical protein
MQGGHFDDLIPGNSPQPGGVVVGTHAAPPRLQYEAPLAAADLHAKEQEARLRELQIQEARDKAAANATVVPNSNVHGDAYLKALPPQIVGVVKKVASGDITLPANALRTPYWQQMLQHVVNYDPEFSAIDYNTRAATRKDYAVGKMGVNITALNTALGHAGEVMHDVQDLGNSGGFLGTTFVNPIRNWYRGRQGDPRPGNLINDTRAFGGEMGKVFASGGGTEGERTDWSTSIPLDGSQEQQYGILQHDAKLLRSRLQSVNEQYQRGMGHTSDITDLLTPEARQVYQQLLSGQSLGAGPVVPGALGPPRIGGGSPGGPPSGPAGPTIGPGLPDMPNGGPQMGAATGDTRREFDPVVASKTEAMIRAGRSPKEVNDFLGSAGHESIPADQIIAIQNHLKTHPHYSNFVDATKEVPTTAWQRVSASPLAGYTSGATNALTAGYSDEIGGGLSALLGGDYTQTRDMLNANKHAIADLNPKSDFAGNLTGGILATLAGGGAISRIKPLAQLASSAPGAVTTIGGDAAYGALYGSGENNEDRLGGAVLGGALGAGGGMAARGAVKGLASVIAPTGGALRPLYDAGVFPTLGQRAAAATGPISKPLGKVFNLFEQGMQSIPLLGGLPARARQIPRDQFQIGAFNDALGDIGQQLPEGTHPGHAPHGFTQDAFRDAYDAARSGMQFVPDQPYMSDLAAFQQRLANGTLDAVQAQQVGQRIQTAVGSRLRGGALPGDAYKAAASDLADTAREGSRSDPAKASALNDYLTIFDNAARRNSHPDAVAALDNADRGYAKFVRIQDAAAARGGDSGTFSPAQYDRAVQRNSGGVRSSAYNRGDALGQAYGDAGKALVDTLPNSGTADRLLTGQAVGGLGGGGLGALAPTALAALAKPGALALSPYLPGLNKVVTRLIAPRSATLPPALAAPLENFGTQLNNRAATIGRLGAPVAVQFAPWLAGELGL